MIEKIERLGEKINRGFDSRNDKLIEICIDEGTAIVNNEPLNSDEHAILYYFLGNAWSDKDILKNYRNINEWYYNRTELINAIKYFRKCVSINDASNDIKEKVFIQAYTNLGNMFSHAGRIIYAIEAWKKALVIIPNFGMAGCNLSHGLIVYAINLYDKNHSALLLRYAYKKMHYFLKYKDIHPKARKAFILDIKKIEKIIDINYLTQENDFKVYSLGRSKREKNYKNWILFNSLYLNPLNDIFFDSAVAHDVFMLPNMMVKQYPSPVFQGFYNQLKQEYISARYLFYLYKYELPEDKIHFSDKNRNLIDTLDYPQYGFRYELLKNSFKMAYSIFDKIGYFINEYFALGIDRNRVYFKRIWYDKKKEKINDKIESLNNLPLRGLYFLSKDFFDSDEEYLAVTEPDAKKIAEIRNHLEHKYFKLHWIGPIKKGDENDIRFDELAYSINESDFSSKTLNILRCVREALIYLSLAVHLEEKKHSTDGGIVMPLPLFKYDEK